MNKFKSIFFNITREQYLCGIQYGHRIQVKKLTAHGYVFKCRLCNFTYSKSGSCTQDPGQITVEERSEINAFQKQEYRNGFSMKNNFDKNDLINVHKLQQELHELYNRIMQSGCEIQVVWMDPEGNIQHKNDFIRMQVVKVEEENKPSGICSAHQTPDKDCDICYPLT